MIIVGQSSSSDSPASRPSLRFASRFTRPIGLIPKHPHPSPARNPVTSVFVSNNQNEWLSWPPAKTGHSFESMAVSVSTTHDWCPMKTQDHLLPGLLHRDVSTITAHNVLSILSRRLITEPFTGRGQCFFSFALCWLVSSLISILFFHEDRLFV
jgi:hypothetical protein